MVARKKVAPTPRSRKATVSRRSAVSSAACPQADKRTADPPPPLFHRPEALPELVRRDHALRSFKDHILERMRLVEAMGKHLTGGSLALKDFASGHEYFGLHRTGDGWVFREWAPNASAIYLVGPFSQWKPDPRFQLKRENMPPGVWTIALPPPLFQHGDLYKLHMEWPGGSGERIPAWARRVVQDPVTHVMCAQVWDPPAPYLWKHPDFRRSPAAPLIYECHVGMAREEGCVGSFEQFQTAILPRIVDAGYNTIQFMAILEHPYYGSFGYHVSNYFAVSSRFGTPEEFKALVDAVHGAGLAVIIDLVHSHSVRNETEGLGRFDGTLYQYFHDGPRGNHVAWDSRCFDYGKAEVLHFLLSNCRFWLDEYRVDGFRFDGVTSMLFLDHGLGKKFMSYADYFGANLDPQAETYLSLANRVIHDVRPDALTIAEDVSGMPGLAAPLDHGGLGFDMRLAMGVPDYWIKLIKEVSDEQWHVGDLFHELTNRRPDEQTISYAESHDQALVGDKTIIFRLIDAEMYTHMSTTTPSVRVDRGVALHKMIRLITLATAGNGYLNFMGNEFGHPEWIDFPREGNGWSYHYARRQWHLRDDFLLRYRFLAEFDKAMIALAKSTGLLNSAGAFKAYEHVSHQVLALKRADLLFLFNFSPTQSWSDLQIEVDVGGDYRLVLDSDATEMGGFGRVAFPQAYKTLPQRKVMRPVSHLLKVYLPSRTALVLQHVG